MELPTEKRLTGAWSCFSSKTGKYLPLPRSWDKHSLDSPSEAVLRPGLFFCPGAVARATPVISVMTHLGSRVQAGFGQQTAESPFAAGTPLDSGDLPVAINRNIERIGVGVADGSKRCVLGQHNLRSAWRCFEIFLTLRRGSPMFTAITINPSFWNSVRRFSTMG